MKKLLLILTSSAILLNLSVNADVTLDKKYAFESIGLLKPWDNAEGIFSEYILEAFEDYFKIKSQFQFKKFDKADPVLMNSKIPYFQLIDDQKILEQLARKFEVTTLLKTKAYKEMNRYRFVMEWLQAPRMHLIAKETFYVSETEDGKLLESKKLKTEVASALNRLFEKVPFKGIVTGRDKEWVTIGLGLNDGIKKGDAVFLGTIEDVKIHPLLNELLDWQLVKTGEIVIDDLDDRISFGKIKNEESGKEIRRYQKVTKIIPRESLVTSGAGPEGIPLTQGPLEYSTLDNGAASDVRQIQNNRDREDDIPRLGYIEGGPLFGLYSRDYKTSSGSGSGGGGFLFGADVKGQLWLTKEFFTDLGIRYGFSSITQESPSTGAELSAAGGTASIRQFRFDLGYQYLVAGQIFGPKGLVRLGYQSTSYSLPDSSTNLSGDSSFSGVFFGLGGDLPFESQYGALFNLELGLINSAEDLSTGIALDKKSATSVSFYLGGYRWFAQKVQIRAGLDFVSHTADLSNNSHVSQKSISFLPTIVYFF